MSILVIGGDKLGNIKDKLKENGFNKIDHISGRKKGDRKIKISEGTDLVLVLTDYIGHNISEIIKNQSKRSDVTIMFCKRSWSSMYKNIENYITQIKKV
ncbi:DUF2325 domain-containing protein [Clostridium luticellarii]|uniref:Dihydroorotate dehydrogenase n=1 Tax=Clostridium luticellarii TaxID=1691940 RepID=A0A2T0BML7_9CLOT|nr:DUF2325 domain-containing protein [Clostridium luticellarii]MCI1945238.1 DUF2325 domain-containing protein [Clostridium luticellarii]MCI1969652.1 DUF2325 domain-containing protein [Clostridium luticellarii]MCI1994571.1 DUF2325 domain-containing protein [Clostridium luticellarii]MCI2038932.1 DUF2325 domain-containing protein [Clostridium luticellarii]PRR85111.1 hypothetical protein CLLU_19390 [Clostridium luticellarii]